MKLPFLLLSAMCFLLCEGSRMKIINGHEAARFSRPYMALIKFERGDYEKFCGGSLIRDRWVLTAGHCDMPGWKKTVILGAHSSEERDRWWQTFRLEKSFAHPSYNETSLNADLRLIKLRKRAILTKAVQLLPLPTTFKDPKEESTCDTAGWGKTEKAETSDTLLEVNVTVFDREQCAKHWKKRTTNITENMVCTIVRPGGGDTCVGDSGGPLICNGVLTGLTSFGENVCGKVNDVSVFTRLTKEYIRWINEKITD